MSATIFDLKILLETLDPYLNEGVFVFTCVPFDTDFSNIPLICSFREREGLTVILAESDAVAAGFPILYRAAWITLSVNSDLNAVGLTAAVSAALRDAGISCNVVAGAFHDHLFVPAELGTTAIEVLNAIRKS